MKITTFYREHGKYHKLFGRQTSMVSLPALTAMLDACYAYIYFHYLPINILPGSKLCFGNVKMETPM